MARESLVERIDASFAGRYDWFSFFSGKASQKHQSYSRAYIDFKKPEDVIEFAEAFDGHVFVNEKGSQFKITVEYAPSQRVPKQSSKKDGREGTIFKDPEYLEFLESLSKPPENLPSAEIQYERREAERAGAAKDAPIVTPLMDFVRQQRAVKGGPRRALSNGKPSRRAGGSSAGSPSSTSSKRGNEKRRTATTMYVLKDSAKSASGKEKKTYILISKRDDQQLSDKSVAVGPPVPQGSREQSGSGMTDGGRKKVLLMKGKDKDISHFPGSSLPQQATAGSVKNIMTGHRQSQRREGSGRIIKGILFNKDSRQAQSSGIQSEYQIQISNSEKDRRPPRSPHLQLAVKDTSGISDDKGISNNDLHGYNIEKHEKRTRSRDRPDRGVWAPLRRSEGTHASDESLSSASSQPSQSLLVTTEGTHGDTKADMPNIRGGEVKILGSGRSFHSSIDNGSYKQLGRRGSHGVKDVDGSTIISEVKPLKRGSSTGYGSHEKQIWVQKSSSGS